MTCVLGVIVGALVTHDTHVFLIAFALAIAEGLAMAAGSYLSEQVNAQTIRHAALIGIASFIGILLPAVPFLVLPLQTASSVAWVITFCMGALIAYTRVKELGVVRAYMQTFTILTIVLLVTALATALVNMV